MDRPFWNRPRRLERRGSTAAIALILLGLALAILWNSTAGAVLLASGNGTQNTTPPVDDPGFSHVGIISGLSGVYIGQGWVLTARHVGQGSVELAGTVYPVVPGSYTQLVGSEPDPPDLAMMKIAGDPGLPDLTLATSRPPANAEVILIGHGKDRGDATSWSGHSGWAWANAFTMRWGTNRVNGSNSSWVLNTMSFQMDFDVSGTQGNTSSESQFTLGDSGGAVFWKHQGQWKLAGINFAANTYSGQPDKTSLDGNLSIAADLSVYRDEILTLAQIPACQNGLDDDLDGLIDSPNDPGCDNPSDSSERSAALACDDGLDNDGDGHIDHPADPQCTTPSTPTEFSPVAAGSLWSTLALISGLGWVGMRSALRATPLGTNSDQSTKRTR